MHLFLTTAAVPAGFPCGTIATLVVLIWALAGLAAIGMRFASAPPAPATRPRRRPTRAWPAVTHPRSARRGGRITLSLGVTCPRHAGTKPTWTCPTCLRDHCEACLIVDGDHQSCPDPACRRTAQRMADAAREGIR